jgi:hypothetical protein
MSKISDHFKTKSLKRKVTEVEHVEISSDDEDESHRGDRAEGAKTDDPQVIYKKVTSGEIKGVYRPLDRVETAKDLGGILNNAQVMSLSW